ncbi:MAG: immunoglobulin-like domain-containing protein, partial [Flavobacteriaceae bacterium]
MITLYGLDTITLSQGDGFAEPGFSATDINGDPIPNSDVIVNYPFDISLPLNTPGSYTITYDVTDASGASATQQTRTVIVLDTEPPIINLLGISPVLVYQGQTYSDAGVTVSDNVDSPNDIAVVVNNDVNPNIAGTYSVIYNATDSAGNSAVTVVRDVEVKDTEPPLVTVLGSNPYEINQGVTYVDPNPSVNAIDNVDGNISNQVQSTGSTYINENIPGTYPVTYTVDDAAGNQGSAIRSVIVLDTEPPVINLIGSNSAEVNQGDSYTDAGATVSDNVDSNVSLVSQDNVNTNIPGAYSYIYTASDSSGNDAAPAVRNVTVLDTEAPVIVLLGTDPYYIDQDVFFVDPGFSASDNVDGNMNDVVVPSGNVNTALPDTYTRTYTATDSSSNTFTITRQVIVNDTERPVIVIEGDNPFNISQNQAFNDPGVTITDNVDDVSQIQTSSTGTVDITTPGQYNITYQATDTSGNNAISKTRVVVVSDSEDPVITLLGSNPITIDQGTAYNEPGATASDNQDGTLTVVITGDTVDINSPGDYSIIYSATDSAGNSVSITRTVIVLDKEAPVIQLDGPVTTQINQGVTYIDQGASVSDNHDTNVILVEQNNVNSNVPGTYTYTYNATDSAGNTAIPAIRNVTVVDTEAPTINLLGPNNLSINQNANYTEQGATATDNVDGNVSVSITGTVDTSTPGVYIRYYDAIDAAGNPATQVTRTITVLDTEAPIITVLGANPDSVNQGTVYNDPGATAEDNGNNIGPVVASPATLDTSNAGTFNIIYSIEDSSGNSATAVRTVEIVDTEKPTISLLGAEPLSINQDTSYTEQGATATDNVDGNVSVSITGTVDTSTPGVYIRYYDAIDAAGNPATQVTRTITVLDTEAPIITVLGANPDSVNQGTVYNDPGATAEDNGNNIGPVVASPATLDTSNAGTFNIIYSIEDSSGNSATAARTVNVLDRTPPIITVSGPNPQQSALGSEYVDPGVSAFDNVDGPINQNSINKDYSNININAIGTFTANYSVFDSSGNEGVNSRTVNIVDMTPPVVTLIGNNPEYINQGETYNDPGVTVTDNVDADGTITPLYDQGTFNAAVAGTYTITWSATDAAGNTATVNRNVVVRDITPPVITILPDNPFYIDQGETYTDPGATATDNVDGDLTAQLTDNANAISTLTPGNFTVTYTVTDSSGNTATADRGVVVNDTQAPVITLIGDNPFNLTQGDVYNEPGYNATDNVDDDVVLTANVTNDANTALDVNNPGPYTITYTVQDTAGNEGTAQRVVNVNALPATPSEITGPVQTIFQGDENVSFSVDQVAGASSYEWTFPAGVDIVSGLGTREVVVNISNTAVSGDVSVFARNSFGDGPSSPVYNLVIEPIPPADPGIDRAICLNETTVLGGATDPLADTYSWTSVPEDTNFIATDWNPTVQPLQTTIYTLTVTYSNGATNSNSVEITVNPLPNVEVIDDTTVCENESISIGGSVNPALEYNWTSVPAGFTSNVANPTLFPADLTVTREYFLTVTNPATGCTNTDSVIITVEQLPVISAGPASDTICESQTIYSLDQATSSITDNTSVVYEWTSVGGNPSQFGNPSELITTFEPSAQDIANGSVVLQLKATPVNFCSETSVVSQLTLNIEAAPTANVGLGGTICGDDTFQITATATNGSISWLQTGLTSGTLDNYNIANPVYTPSAEDIANGQATFELTVSPNSPCADIASDTITILITEPHAVSLPSDYVICENETVQLNATVENQTSIVWQSAGDGNFNPTNGTDTPNPIYIPGPQDIINGFAVVTVKVVGNDPCGIEKTAETRITINKNAQVNAGPDGVFCEGVNSITNASALDYDTLQWSSSGDGSFNNISIANPSYTPGPNDLSNGTVTLTLTATHLNACATDAVDDAVFVVNKTPIAYAGSDQTICEDDAITISQATAENQASILWTSSGTGQWNDPTLQNPIYTPSNQDVINESVTLTMTLQGEGVCPTDADSMVLNIVKKPTASAGLDVSICQGDQIVIDATAQNYASITWTKTGGSGILLNETSEDPTYIASANDVGPVILTMTVTPLSADGTTACGSDVTDSVQILIENTPIADAGPDKTICEGESYTFNSGEVVAANFSSLSWTAVGGGDGTFSGGSSRTPTYTPGPNDIAAGSVILRLTANPISNCPTPAISEMTLNITKVPEADAGADLSMCEDEGSITINDAVVAHFDDLLWTSSGTAGTLSNADQIEPTYTPSAADIASGSVTLTLTASRTPANCGEQTTDVKVITFVKNPVANAGMDAVICDQGSYLLGDATALNAASIVWTTSGDGTFSPSNQVQNPIYNPGPLDIANGGTITLTITSNATAPCVQNDTDNMLLTLDPTPTVDVGPTQSVCEGSDFTVNLTDGVDVTNATSFSWSTNGDGSFSNPNILNPVYTPGTNDKANGLPVSLTLSVTSGNECTLPVSDSFDLNIVPQLFVDAGPDVTICEDGFTVSSANQTVNYNNVSWSFVSGTGQLTNINSLTPTYVPSAADITAGQVELLLTAYPNVPCTGPQTDTIIVTINQNPIVEAGNDGSICAGENFTVSGAQLLHFSTYSWSSITGGTFENSNTLTPTYIPSEADKNAGFAILRLTAQPSGACADEIFDELEIQITPLTVVSAGSNATICEGETYTTVGASVTNGINPEWTTSAGVSTGFANPNLTTTTYTPTATDISIGYVDLTLIANQVAPCTGQVSETIRLTITPKATLTLSSTSAEICETDTYTFASGQVTAVHAEGIVWQTSGNGTFDDATSLTPTYTPTSNDIALGQVTLTVSADAGAACSNPTDTKQFTLSFKAEPLIDLSQSPTTVCMDDSITLDAQITDYSTVLWSIESGGGSLNGANTLTPTYTPDGSSSTVILKLVAQPENPCASEVSSLLTIDVTALPEIITFPTASAGSCALTPYIVSGVTTNGEEDRVVWSSTGTGTFDNNNDLNPTYTPSQADLDSGSVILTMTAEAKDPCSVIEDVSESFTLTLKKTPVIYAGADDTVCEGSDYTVSDATQTDAALPTTASISWSSNTNSGTFTSGDTLTPTYTPGPVDLQNGFFILTLKVQGEAPCGEVTDTKRVDIIKNPVVELEDSATTCSNTPYTIIPLEASEFSSLQWTSNGGDGSFDNTSILQPTYTPGPLDIANGVILTLEALPRAPCATSQSASINLSFTTAPTVDAGPDADVCEGEAYTFASLQASATNYSSIQWSGGSGSWTSANTITPTYQPSNTEIALGQVTLTLKAQGNGNCDPVSDFMTLSITKKPIITIGSNLEICAGETVSISDVSVLHTASYVWSAPSGSFDDPTSLQAVYTPATGVTGPVDLTLTATPNTPCADDVSAIKTITIVAPPVVDAGDNFTFCEESGQFSINDASIIGDYTGVSWSASGTGLLTTSSGIPTYVPNTQDYINGFVELTMSVVGNGTCPAQSDTVKITLVSNPTATIPVSNASICEGDTYTISGAQVTNEDSYYWTSTSGTLTPLTGSLSPVFTPDPGQTGTVTLTLHANGTAPCTGTAEASVVISIDQAPEASIDPLGDICANQTVSLNGSVQFNDGFLWETTGSGTFTGTNSLTPDYTPSATDETAGSVQFTLTAFADGACSSDAVVTQTLTIGSVAEVDAGPEVAVICEGGSYILSQATYSEGENPVWTIVSGSPGTIDNPNVLNPTFTPTADDVINGSVILRLSVDSLDPCNTVVSDDITINITSLPVVDAGSDTAICAGTYTHNGATVSEASSFAWSVFSGNGTIDPATVNTISPVYITDPADENNTVTLRLTATPNTPCSGFVFDDVEFTVTPAPIVEAGADATICQGDIYTFTNGASRQNTLSTVWSHNGTGILVGENGLNPTYTPSEGEYGSVVFTLTGQGNDPCVSSATDTFTLEITPQATVDAGPDATICESSYQLSGSVTNGSNPRWSTSGNGNFPSGNLGLTTLYEPSADDIALGYVDLILTVDRLAPCAGEKSDDIRLFLNQAPVISLGGSTASICEDETYTFSSANVSGAVSVLWQTTGDGTFSPSNGDVQATYIPGNLDKSNGGAQLSLTATGAQGCATTTENFDLTIDAGPEIILPLNTFSVCASETSIQLSGNTITNYGNIIWSSTYGTFDNNNIANPIYYPTSEDVANGQITLSVQATATNSCSQASFDTITINLVDDVTVEAGSDQTICEGTTLQINGASVTNQSNYLWTTAGDGVFTGSDPLNPVYAPGTNDVINGGTTLTLTATGGAGCSNTLSDFLTLTIVNNPFVDAGPTSETICAGDDLNLVGIANDHSSVEWLTDGDGIFVDYFDLNTIYEPGPNDISNGGALLTLVAYGQSACSVSVDDTIALEIQASISVEAGPDATVCDGESFDLSETIITNLSTNSPATQSQDYQSIEWITSGTGFFTNTNNLNPTYNPSAADYLSGSVVLTIEVTPNVSCSAAGVIDSDMILSFDGVISGTGTITGFDVVCEGSGPYNYQISGLSGATDYIWQANSPSASITPTANQEVVAVDFSDAGNYIISVIPSNECGLGAAIDFTVTVNPDGVITHDGTQGTLDQTHCEGEAIDPIVFSLSGGATGATASGLPAGLLFDPVALTITGTPTDDITSVATYTYTVTTTGSGCAPDDITGTITINPLDKLTTTSDTAQVVCSATAIAPITYSLGGGATGASISWDVVPSGITFDSVTATLSGTAPTVSTSTTYTYTLTSTGGSCPDTATGTLTVNPDGVITHDGTQGTL